MVRVRFLCFGRYRNGISKCLELIIHASTFVKQRRDGKPINVKHHPPMYVGH
jgi:hypothetical protein